MNDKPATNLEIAIDQMDTAAGTIDEKRARTDALIGIGYALVALAEGLKTDREDRWEREEIERMNTT